MFTSGKCHILDEIEKCFIEVFIILVTATIGDMGDI